MEGFAHGTFNHQTGAVDQPPDQPVPLEPVKRGGKCNRRCRAQVTRPEGRKDIGEEEVKQTAVEVGPMLSEGSRRRRPEQRRIVRDVAETVYEGGEGPGCGEDDVGRRPRDGDVRQCLRVHLVGVQTVLELLGRGGVCEEMPAVKHSGGIVAKVHERLAHRTPVCNGTERRTRFTIIIA